MKIRMTSLTWLLFTCVSLGQEPQPTSVVHDPTVPSPAIKQLLANTVPTVAAPDPKSSDAQPSNTKSSNAKSSGSNAMASLRLRAIVLSDIDHGSAIVELGERRYFVPLRRDKLADSRNGISIDGQTFRVIDFTASSVVIDHGDQTYLVK
ncbi:MAG: hypothetical protein IT423_24065 [Pirellulaceae bacterium]|nr:hypothetical protein [Pirellulaceae bacterium]